MGTMGEAVQSVKYSATPKGALQKTARHPVYGASTALAFMVNIKASCTQFPERDLVRTDSSK